NAVWAAVLGTILVALAAGYAAGGRLSHRGASPAALPVSIVAAGAWIAGLAFFAPTIARALASGPTALGEAPAVLLPSVLASGLLFGPPMVLLAASSPLLVS